MATQEPPKPPGLAERISQTRFLDLLTARRSRRFSLGMSMPGGPLAYTSRFEPAPLTEDEEAALAFAACGVTGHTMADFCFAPGHGGNMIAGLVGRTIASGDAIQAVSLIVSNDTATCLVRRPQDLSPAEVEKLIAAGEQADWGGFYRQARVKFRDGRPTPPKEPLFNINLNQWSAHAPGTTSFLPVNELSFMYINGLLEIFNETTAAWVLDERNSFQPAGLEKFGRSHGGHLEDDPLKGRVATVSQVERLVTEFVTVEQGMMVQNLGLMAEAMGLGGYPSFANHDFGWFEALGFRMGSMPASRYLGAGPIASWGMRMLGKNPPVPYPLGLEAEGMVLLKAYCPPWHPDMRAAVEAVVDRKFGREGVFRGATGGGCWQQSEKVRGQVPEISERAIEATVAYCEYLWKRYGRFPVHMPAFRTVVCFQAGHLDAEFYDRFYKPEALGTRQREDFDRQDKRRRK